MFQTVIDDLFRNWLNLTPKQFIGTIFLVYLLAWTATPLLRLLVRGAVRLGLAGQWLRRRQREGDLAEQVLLVKLANNPQAAAGFAARQVAKLVAGTTLVWAGWAASIYVVAATAFVLVAKGTTGTPPSSYRLVALLGQVGSAIVTGIGLGMVINAFLSLRRFYKHVAGKLEWEAHKEARDALDQPRPPPNPDPT